MDNVHTNTTVGVMKPPEDWDHSEVKVNDLYVTTGTIGKHKAFATYWRPSQDEIDILVCGGAIEVLALGAQVPIQVNVLAIPEIDSEASVISDVPEITQ